MGSGRRAGTGAAGLAPGTEDLLQAATRMLAGVALRSLDALDDAVTLPQGERDAAGHGRRPPSCGQQRAARSADEQADHP